MNIKNKVVLVGSGMVGSTILYAMLSQENIAEIVIIDKSIDKALGEAIDISHGTSFAYSPNVLVRTGTYEDCKDASIIIISAGKRITRQEEKYYTQVMNENIEVIDEIMKNIVVYTRTSSIIIVTNPVDIITYYVQKNFDYNSNRIIGTGTIIDTARLRRLLAGKYMIDAKNVHGYILGEKGETGFCTWSLVNVAGIPVNQLDYYFNSESPLDKEVIMEEVKNVGYDILKYKGYSNYGIATSVTRLIKAMLLNEQSILPVSTTLMGEYGIENIALSIPCVIGANGIERSLEIPLDKKEEELLHNSANKLKNKVKEIKIT